MEEGKPFHLINKYYDENFILEDDEEEGFKNYIYNNNDSRSILNENSMINSTDNLEIKND